MLSVYCLLLTEEHIYHLPRKRVSERERNADMRIMDVFSVGMPTANPGPDPRHLHDKDKARGWDGRDAQGRPHHWRWDYRNNRWY